MKCSEMKCSAVWSPGVARSPSAAPSRPACHKGAGSEPSSHVVLTLVRTALLRARQRLELEEVHHARPYNGGVERGVGPTARRRVGPGGRHRSEGAKALPARVGALRVLDHLLDCGERGGEEGTPRGRVRVHPRGQVGDGGAREEGRLPRGLGLRLVAEHRLGHRLCKLGVGRRTSTSVRFRAEEEVGGLGRRGLDRHGARGVRTARTAAVGVHVHVAELGGLIAGSLGRHLDVDRRRRRRERRRDEPAALRALILVRAARRRRLGEGQARGEVGVEVGEGRAAAGERHDVDHDLPLPLPLPLSRRRGRLRRFPEARDRELELGPAHKGVTLVPRHRRAVQPPLHAAVGKACLEVEHGTREVGGRAVGAALLEFVEP
mmetsp:Transcript_24735/g.57145  ORF Transcript_24735/g.57145 Transcript_24735/m.57145 type:complete len:377 (-) Transcript_24735:471-1601(-)